VSGPSTVDRYLNRKTHRVPMAEVNVLSFASNLRRRAKEVGLRVSIKQDGDVLVVSTTRRQK
jgi:hypothetical protein